MDPVVHFELPSDDRERAKSFYTDVFGWEIEESPFEDDVYTSVITSPVDDEYLHEESGAINGAIIDREEETPTPLVTIEVDDIESYESVISEAGGEMIVEKGEVPESGYFAYFTDSEDNVVGLWEPM